MAIKILLLLTLLFYTVIVGQSFSYIISLRNVQRNMTAMEYIPFRKQTDRNFRLKFKPVIYLSLLLNFLLVIVCAVQVETMLLLSSSVSFIALLADTFIALKGNLPINNIINSWTIEKYPEDWKAYRRNWLRLFASRQALNIIGFMSLLAAAVFY